MAESECFRIERELVSSEESFILSAVLMTKDLRKKEEKDTMILIPGGPGGDSQGLRMSLDRKDMLNAFWAHMNLNVVAYDPRGTGRSQLQQEAQYYSQDVFYTSKQVEDLKAVIDSTSPHRPVVLFAHSAGGNLAARLASLYPERVKGLILYSASIDTREIGLSNLRIFQKSFPFWQESMTSCPAGRSEELNSERREIERFLRNTLKARRLNDNTPSELDSSFYLKTFRIELIQALENDPDCSRELPEALEKWRDKIAGLPEQTQNFVNNQSSIQFDPDQHQPPLVKRGAWIRTAVICSEGITREEASNELWLEGLNFAQDTCFGVTPIYDTPPSRDWLKEIVAPTLVLGGSLDPLQIPSAVKRNASNIPHSELVIFEGGGHESHLTHPMEFYDSLDSFLNSL